jgi:hypothetical protein
MHLTKLKVRNYLSVNGECELPIDGRVTILLGANDHGKSNLLRALEHLNFGNAIKEDDQNWDSTDCRLDFLFHLNEAETQRITAMSDEYLQLMAQAEQSEHRAQQPEPEDDDDETRVEPQEATTAATTRSPGAATATAPAVSTATVSPKPTPAPLPAAEEDEREPTAQELFEETEFLAKIARSSTLTLTRDGVGASLSVDGRSMDELPEVIYDLLQEITPRNLLK